MIASQLVGVQPLNAPSALAYYLNYKYASLEPAPQDVVDAIVSWITEQFTSRVNAGTAGHFVTIFHVRHVCNDYLPTLCSLNVYDGSMIYTGQRKKVPIRFDLYDSECFQKLYDQIDSDIKDDLIAYFDPVCTDPTHGS